MQKNIKKYRIKDEFKKTALFLCFLCLVMFILLCLLIPEHTQDFLIIGFPFLFISICFIVTAQAEVFIDEEGIRHYNKVICNLVGSQYAKWNDITLAHIKYSVHHSGWIEIYARKEKGYSKVEIPFFEYSTELIEDIVAHLSSEVRKIDFENLKHKKG